MDDGIVERTRGRGGEIVLRHRDGVFEIVENGVFLMDTRDGASERLLVRAAADAMPPRGRMAIGGLGVGFSLAEALAQPGVHEVHVIEREEAVLRWNRGPLASVNEGALDDDRVRVHRADLADWLTDAAPAAFDALCLDVDNGPDWTVTPSNEELYRESGLAGAARVLSPGGVLTIWSAAPVPGARVAAHRLLRHRPQHRGSGRAWAARRRRGRLWTACGRLTYSGQGTRPATCGRRPCGVLPCGRRDIPAASTQRRPSFLEQAGQALQPCSSSTRSATAICSARLAFVGLPLPPNAFQVDGVNCRPPEKPLPVLVDQLPPLSHCARRSHVLPEAAFAVPAIARGPPTATRPATMKPTIRPRVVMLLLLIAVPVSRRASDGRPHDAWGATCSGGNTARGPYPVPP